MSSKLEILKKFNQNKDIQKELSDFESLGQLFETHVDHRLLLYTKNKEECQKEKASLEGNLAELVKIKHVLQSYLGRWTIDKAIERFSSLDKIVDENIELVKQKIDRIDKIYVKLTKNKNSIMALINDHLKTVKTKARDESLALYNNTALVELIDDEKIRKIIKQSRIPPEVELKIEELRTEQMRKIYIKYYNTGISQIINIIIHFFNI
jgi:hypothetical protein